MHDLILLYVFSKISLDNFTKICVIKAEESLCSVRPKTFMCYLTSFEPHRAQQSNQEFPFSPDMPTTQWERLSADYPISAKPSVPFLAFNLLGHISLSVTVNQRSQSHLSTTTRDQAPHLLTSC